MTPATARRTARWLLLALAIAILLALLGCRPTDVLLGACPALCPPFWRTLPRDQRRTLLRRRIPVLVTLTMLAALALGASNASALAAPMPWANAAWFGVYLLAWILLLHGLRLLLDRLLRPLLRTTTRRNILLAVATIAIGFPNLYVALQTHRIAVAGTPSSALPLGTEITFTTIDGVELHGAVFEATNAIPTTNATTNPIANQSPHAPLVIVCHGLGADRHAFAGYTAMALRLGALAARHRSGAGLAAAFAARTVAGDPGRVGARRWRPGDPAARR
jgi:hypothetical protein